ncbi:helix-turn-helix transcriptional regulator [Adlercreutzia sp. R21]|uniref:Helix-turn-helix transcriptional regulator n=1 Tax=Adlercreutzia wanghongyangiae TaxID=3111451 RepID=A0ABU6IKM2_9ACTN|nr:helix-turn-helix transcriptional regulator [Adlercreutzia sp. R21]MEC4177015.1 helix-turn-helix transcriptional regulator [Adlercreutzia sp. R7]MEC4184783.1 helix-turn-helix transcriptional regulator [Adlercreutzia sp. R21]
MNWTNVYGLDQLGSFLQRTRKEKGYTQDEFAEIIGTSHATLSALENGKSVSSQTLMRAVSDLGLKLVVLPKGSRAEVHEDSVPAAVFPSSREEGGEA